MGDYEIGKDVLLLQQQLNIVTQQLAEISAKLQFLIEKDNQETAKSRG